MHETHSHDHNLCLHKRNPKSNGFLFLQEHFLAEFFIGRLFLPSICLQGDILLMDFDEASARSYVKFTSQLSIILFNNTMFPSQIECSIQQLDLHQTPQNFRDFAKGDSSPRFVSKKLCPIFSLEKCGSHIHVLLKITIDRKNMCLPMITILTLTNNHLSSTIDVICSIFDYKQNETFVGQRGSTRTKQCLYSIRHCKIGQHDLNILTRIWQ